MAVYNAAVARTDLGDGGIIPIQYAREIIKNTPKSSVMLTRGRRVTMTSKERTQPVLNLFPQAYWVNGDTGLKQTTKQQWGSLKMTAEELAVIVPVPDAIIDDANIDLWGEITPAISESIGKLVDQACIFGVGKPTSWPDGCSVACARQTVRLSIKPRSTPPALADCTACPSTRSRTARGIPPRPCCLPPTGRTSLSACDRTLRTSGWTKRLSPTMMERLS